MQPKVETSLQRALESNAGPEELIDVVLSFQPATGLAASPPMPLLQRREVRAAAMSKTIEQALARAEQATGAQPTQVTPFPLTGSAFVQAPRRYFRALLDQDEVAGAMLNSSASQP